MDADRQMKTAEQIAVEYTAGLFNTLSRDRYLTNKDIGVVRRQIAAALKEYGEAVRQKAAGVCKQQMYRADSRHNHGVAACAAAIERMELP